MRRVCILARMGVKIWGAGLVVAALVSVVGASGAPIVQAADVPAKVLMPAAFALPIVPKPSAELSELPASLADTRVANTPKGAAPDHVDFNWPCKLPMRIYYAGSPSIDSRRILRELAYPVEYLRDLGYDVTIVREVAYRYDYTVPTTPGDVLMIVTTNDVAKTALAGPKPAWGISEYNLAGRVDRAAKITINGNRGLPSDVLLHELGHVIGLDHKDGTAMTARGLSTGAFDAAETAAVDCR